MKSNIGLPFDGGLLLFDLPPANLSGIYSPIDQPALENLDHAISRALDHPLGQPPIKDWVRPSDQVLIISDDNTRFTPCDRIIPAMLDRMNQAGVKDEQISCIMALGTHRYMTEDEMKEKAGPAVYHRIRVFNHEWRRPDRLTRLGASSRGTPISINRAVVEADVVIGLGTVVPHHIPGYSGSGKIIQPGVSGPDTTADTHMLACSGGGDSFLGMADNPVRADLEEIAETVGMNTIFNVVLNRNQETVGVFYGRRDQVFPQAVNLARRVFGFQYRETPDIVVCGAHPCELDFWQSHKSQYPAQRMVKPGGVIILCTPAPEGVSPVHTDLLDYTAWPSQKIKDAYWAGELKNGVAAALAAAWAMVREKADVITFSPGIPEEDKMKLGHTHAPTVDWALEEAFRRQGSKARVAVLTHAPDLLPIHVKD